VDVAGGAGARMDRIAAEAAFAGIKRSNEHEPCGIGDRHEGPGNGDTSVFHGLAKHLEHMLFEFVLGNCNIRSFSSNIHLENANIDMKM